LKEPWEQAKATWRLPDCLRERTTSCDVYAIDFDGDASPELLVISVRTRGEPTIFKLSAQGHWDIAATLPSALSNCPAFRQGLQGGNYRLVPSRTKALEIAGQRLEFAHETPELDCPSDAKASSTKP
jgi:hypothetical protein